MNKPIFLGLSILEISNVMYQFWHDHIKPKYHDRIDTDRFIVNIYSDDVYKDVTNDVEKRSDISNYEVEKLLTVDKNKR